LTRLSNVIFSYIYIHFHYHINLVIVTLFPTVHTPTSGDHYQHDHHHHDEHVNAANYGNNLDQLAENGGEHERSESFERKMDILGGEGRNEETRKIGGTLPLSGPSVIQHTFVGRGMVKTDPIDGGSGMFGINAGHVFYQANGNIGTTGMANSD
jgi:hypothetical protein